MVILQDLVRVRLSCKILQEWGYLARSCKSEVILQDLARVRLSCKSTAMNEPISYKKQNQENPSRSRRITFQDLARFLQMRVFLQDSCKCWLYCKILQKWGYLASQQLWTSQFHIKKQNQENPSRSRRITFQDLARFLQMMVILQDLARVRLSCEILQEWGYLARSCKSEVILQDLARVRLSCKSTAMNEPISYKKAEPRKP